MKKCVLLFFLFPAQFGLAQQVQSWYKGNLHTHSYWSDGDEFPEMIMDWYKQRGYNFVALSDHNILAEGEKWKLIAKSKAHMDGFEKYLARYGKDWVTYKVDTGRTHVKLKTLEEYRKLFEDRNFLIIRAEELTDKFENKQVHMNATNIQTVIKPQGGSTLQEVMQRNLDAIAAQRKHTNVPIMQHLNHPNFYYSITAQNMIDLQGERFFEVYNGHAMVHNYGDSIHMGTEQIWDEVNIAYARQGKPLLYGLATDDSHNYHIFGPTQSNAGRGWVMVKSESLSPEALITAMEAGRFYASTGVTLADAEVRDNTLYVAVKEEPGVTYRIDFIGVKSGETKSVILSSTDGLQAQFKLTREFVFVRAKVASSKVKTNPLGEDENEAAWVQPARWTGKR
jgi:hypothetical protein